jgi:hypothetical protein
MNKPTFNELASCLPIRARVKQVEEIGLISKFPSLVEKYKKIEEEEELSRKLEEESKNIVFVNDNNFADGSLLDYSNHELTQEQLENITNYFTK